MAASSVRSDCIAHHRYRFPRGRGLPPLKLSHRALLSSFAAPTRPGHSPAYDLPAFGLTPSLRPTPPSSHVEVFRVSSPMVSLVSPSDPSKRPETSLKPTRSPLPPLLLTPWSINLEIGSCACRRRSAATPKSMPGFMPSRLEEEFWRNESDAAETSPPSGHVRRFHLTQ
jgi:hypothetical protein